MANSRDLKIRKKSTIEGCRNETFYYGKVNEIVACDNFADRKCIYGSGRYFLV